MTSLKEAATEYQPKQTNNISELESVPIDALIEDGSGTDQAGKEFFYKFIRVDGREYRIPNIVIEQIQTILKLKPDVKAVKVKKAGAGLATRYKVEVI